jgi:protein PsiE
MVETAMCAVHSPLVHPVLPPMHRVDTAKNTSMTQSATMRLRQHFGRFLNVIELAGLVLIGLATVLAMTQETWKVISAGEVKLTDLLLMFLYLEVIAMDIRYLRLGQLPVRFPLYIAMVSLARDLILRGGVDNAEHLLSTTAGIVLIAVSVFILRVGQHRFPSKDEDLREEVTPVE